MKTKNAPISDYNRKNKKWTDTENQIILDGVFEGWNNQDLIPLLDRPARLIAEQRKKVVEQRLIDLTNSLNNEDDKSTLNDLHAYIDELNWQINSLTYLANKSLIRQTKTDYALSKFKDNINYYCKVKGYLSDFFYDEFNRWIDLTTISDVSVISDDVIKYYESEVERLKKDDVKLTDDLKKQLDAYEIILEQFKLCVERIESFEDDILNMDAQTERDIKLKDLVTNSQEKK